jgi:hypothetical protein
MSSPAPYGEQPKSSGGSFLTIILIILGVIFLLCAGVCGGCYILASRAGTAMVLELQAFGPSLAASMSQEVIDKLGDPVEKVGNPRQITPISFEFDIKGPKGTFTGVPASQVLQAPAEMRQVDAVHRRAHADHRREEMNLLLGMLLLQAVDQMQVPCRSPTSCPAALRFDRLDDLAGLSR